MSTPLLKWAAIISFIVSMVVLIGGGIFAIKDLPPYPEKIVGPDGKVLFQRADILAGQDVYQRYEMLNESEKGFIDSERVKEIKTNRYDPAKDTLVLSPAQVKALEKITLHWERVFKEGERRYGLLPDTSFFERGVVYLLGNLRLVPDLMIIVLGVLPLAIFLFSTYPHLKPREIKEGESVWEKLGVEL
jgi:nitric oxide reductase large subunit